MDPKYFSVKGLSVDDERVPCRTKIGFAGLAFLDPAAEGDDLPEDSRVRVSHLSLHVLGSRFVKKVVVS